MAEAHPLILTDIGLAKALQRKSADIQADITEFAVSDQKGTLDPRRTSPNRILYRGTPEVKAIVDDHTIQYTCRIPAGLEPFLIKEIYLFLDDGTLFAIGQPRVYIGNQLIDYITYTGQTEKPLLVGVSFTNATKILALKNVPMDEFEQSLSILDLSATLGNKILKLRQEVESLKQAREVLFGNDNEFRARIEKLEEDVKTLWENQIAIFGSLAIQAKILLEHRQEIERLKGG
ncbi:phage tail-collar fiber domain-containing protein, partial [Persephonella sp.]